MCTDPPDDVSFIDQALGWTVERYVVDPEYVAMAGLSDGASNAVLGPTHHLWHGCRPTSAD